MNQDEKLHSRFQDYFEAEMEKNPIAATFYGYKHDKYDHLMPNGTLENAEKNTVDLIQQKYTLKNEISYIDLSREGKLDYDLLEYFLDLSIFSSIELANWRAGATSGGPVGDIGSAIYIMFSRDYAPVEMRVQAIISRLLKSPQYLEETKSRWIHPVKLWTEMAIEECPRTIGFLQLVLQILKPQIDESQFKDLTNAIDATSNAITDYGIWIEEKILPKAHHEWIIGPQKFARLIDVPKLGKTPLEILKVGEEALEGTKAQLKQLAEELFPGKSVEEIRDELKAKHPPTFEMVLEHVKELSEEARQFIIDNELMDIPDNETLQVVPTPSFLRPILPFAAYMSPEKFGKDQTGQYVVTPIEDNKEMLKEHNYASSKNTAVHEGYPGHHLQFVSSNLQPNLIRSVVQGTETIEGWAHYCEQLMAEKGFLGKEEVFIQLVDLIWRAVRIIVDIKLHYGLMTFNQAKLFMIEEIGMEEFAVISELKRYTATPGYQLSYLYGKILLLELRDEIKDKLGDKFSDQFFHNTILHNGGLPIYFLRQLFDIKIEEILENP